MTRRRKPAPAALPAKLEPGITDAQILAVVRPLLEPRGYTSIRVSKGGPKDELEVQALRGIEAQHTSGGRLAYGLGHASRLTPTQVRERTELVLIQGGFQP